MFKINIFKIFFVICFLAVAGEVSAATFLPLDKPCNLEPVPAQNYTGQTAICSYCSAYGASAPLHLKWDIKGEFADPVCGLGCWGPSGNSCANWPTGHLFDAQDKEKTNLKPKDDVFVRNPFINANPTGAGTNLQVTCYDKKDVNKTKISAGIRVVSDCSGIGSVCQERKFSDIVADLDAYKPTKITEKNLDGWSSRDDVDKASNNGSGEVADLKADVLRRQKSDSSNVTDAVNSYADLSLGVVDYLKGATASKDAVPLGYLYFNRRPTSTDEIAKFFKLITPEELQKMKELGLLTSDNKFLFLGNLDGLHQVISLGITSHNDDYSKFTMKILDPNLSDSGNGLSGLKNVNCHKEIWQARLLNIEDPIVAPFLREIYATLLNAENNIFDVFPDGIFGVILNQPGVFRPVTVCSDDLGELVPLVPSRYDKGNDLVDINRLKANAVRSNTAGYLSEFNNQINFGNDDNSFGDGACWGISDFVLRTAYLGKFQSMDCHPDGTFSKAKGQPNYLAQVFEPIKNLLQNLGF